MFLRTNDLMSNNLAFTSADNSGAQIALLPRHRTLFVSPLPHNDSTLSLSRVYNRHTKRDVRYSS